MADDDKVPVGVEVPRRLYEEFKEWCRTERHPIGSELAVMMREWLARRKKVGRPRR